MSSFSFGGFDLSNVTSGLNLTDLGEQFKQAASALENSLKDERFGLPRSSEGTPKAPGAEAEAQGQSDASWLQLDKLQQLVANASAQQTDAAPAAGVAAAVAAAAVQEADSNAAQGAAAPPAAPQSPVKTTAAPAEASAQPEGSVSGEESPLTAHVATNGAVPHADPAYAADNAAGAPSAAPVEEVPAEAQPQPATSEAPALPASAPAPAPVELHMPPSVANMDSTALQQLAAQLHAALGQRDHLLEQQGIQLTHMQAAVDSLTRKNEELVLAKAKVSEHDMEQMEREFAARLAVAERKVFALTKERDALKRNSGHDVHEQLIKDKDEIIKAVMAEGEALSKKQLNQETTIKQLRAQAKALKKDAEDLTARLEAEQSRAAAAAAERSATADEMAGLREQQAGELVAERQHYERLLQEARAAQEGAEQRAADVAKQGAARKLGEAESRVEALQATVGELRGELELQRTAADEREDLLSAEVGTLQRRCAEAEARQQEMQGKLPEATQPLLRQIEALQATADEQAAAWAEAERALLQKVAAAEAAAAEAAMQHQGGAATLIEAQARMQALQDQQQEARAALVAAERAAVAERSQRQAAEAEAEALRHGATAAKEALATMEEVYQEQLGALQSREAAAAATAAALQHQLAAAQQKLGKAASAALPQPPALAAPGLKWVLVRDGVDGGDPSSSPAGGGEVAATGGASTPDGDASVAPGERRSAGAGAKGGDSAEDAGRGGVATLWAPGAMMGGGGGGGLLGSARSGSSAAPQVESLRQLISELEATRDELSNELVRTSAAAEEGRSAAQRAADLERALSELGGRHQAAVVMLGEREERLEEVQADVQDMRESYRWQVEHLALELETTRQKVQGR